MVNAYPGTTTFCIKAGIHSINTSITPKTGNTFIGEYGAILDGTGWTSADNTQAAFRAHNEDINNVTIRNLVIRKMPQFAIRGSTPFPQPLAYSPAGADGWIVEHDELHDNLWGVLVGNDSYVRHNNIHHNIGDTSNSDANLWGAAIHASLAQNLTIESNELAYNGANTRLFYTRNCIFRNNYIHDQAWDGIWFDGENTQATITNNVIEDSHAQGIIYEVSGSATISGNIIRRSGDGGIVLASSHNVEVFNNTIEDSGRGINVTVELAHIAEGGGGLEPLSAGNLNIHDNTIRMPTTAGSYASLLTVYNGDETPYTNGSSNITFTRNVYTAPNLTGAYWKWGGAFLTWAQWQAVPQDATGSLTVP
jgi:parallel beta-helix repeat protein